MNVVLVVVICEVSRYRTAAPSAWEPDCRELESILRTRRRAEAAQAVTLRHSCLPVHFVEGSKQTVLSLGTDREGRKHQEGCIRQLEQVASDMNARG